MTYIVTVAVRAAIEAVDVEGALDVGDEIAHEIANEVSNGSLSHLIYETQVMTAIVEEGD